MTQVRKSPAQEAAEYFGFPGRVVRLELADGPVHVAVQLDEREHARRGNLGLGPLTDRGLVTALSTVPTGKPVAPFLVPPWAIKRLKSAESQLTELHVDSIRRCVAPPLVIGGVLATGRKLRRLLTRVGQLSAVAPMGVLVSGEIRATDPALLDARLYGVGVITNPSKRREALLNPQPVEASDGPYQWWVSELAYQQLVLTMD